MCVHFQMHRVFFSVPLLVEAPPRAEEHSVLNAPPLPPPPCRRFFILPTRHKGLLVLSELEMGDEQTHTNYPLTHNVPPRPLPVFGQTATGRSLFFYSIGDEERLCLRHLIFTPPPTWYIYNIYIKLYIYTVGLGSIDDI